MTETNDEYPIATLHDFLQEASEEFRRYRIQARVNFIGAIFLLFFLARFVFLLYETAPFRGSMQIPLLLDSGLLVLAFVAVVWSLDVWRHQRKFISRWGTRFEKLALMEKQLLPEEDQ
jgi:hypothetical protein